MQERWNHPCVVIWDAQNETRDRGNRQGHPGRARPRPLEPSVGQRLWPGAVAGRQFRVASLFVPATPTSSCPDCPASPGVPKGNARANTENNPIIINEYDWLWLNRDGSPTTLSRKVYENLLGPNATAAQRRHLAARYHAALTEFWRAHRACAGVLHFCGLGYSRTNGQTCDNFIDIEKLTFEPEFQRYMSDAFAPVGLMIDEWRAQLPAGKELNVPVVVINDLYQDWKGKVQFRILRGGKPLTEQSRPCDVAALGQTKLSFACAVPTEPGELSTRSGFAARRGEAGAQPAGFQRACGREVIRRTGLPRANPLKPHRLTSSQAAITGRRMRWTGFSTPAGHPNSATRNGWPLTSGLPPPFLASCSIGRKPPPRATPSRFPWTAALGRTFRRPPPAKAEPR